MNEMVKSDRRTPPRAATFAGGVATALLLAIGGFIALAIFTSSDSRDVQWLGMEVESLSADLGQSLGLPGSVTGVYVSDVVGTAAASGVREGDVIVGVNGQPVGGLSDLREVKASTPPGTPVGLEINRGGQVLTATVAEGSGSTGAVTVAYPLLPRPMPVALPPGCATCPNAGPMPVALPPGCATCPNGRGMPVALPPGCATCPNAGSMPVALPPGCATCPNAAAAPVALPGGPATCPSAGQGGLQVGFTRGGVGCPLR